jgi:Xaa-Pro aminopeptidase
MPAGLYPRFSDAEFARRHAAVRAMMARAGVDALVVYGNSSLSRHNQADIHYLSGFLGNRNNYVVMTGSGSPVLFAQSHNHVPNAREMASIRTEWGGHDSARTVAAYIADHGAKSIGYAGEVPVQAYQTLAAALPQAAFKDLSAAFRSLRLVKSDEEIAWLRRGAALTDIAIRNLIENLRPGLREYELGALVESAGLRAGGLAHLCYLSSGPQGAASACVPRQNLTERVLERGDVVNDEISISHWGYSGQIQRPIFVGAPPNDLYRRLCDAALEAYQRGVARLRAGATVEDLLDAAEVIHERGFTINDAYAHGFGIGLLPPSVRTRRTLGGRTHPPFVFEANMCLVLQPNPVTEDETAGVQIGNLLRITEDGIECLHAVPTQYFVTD